MIAERIAPTVWRLPVPMLDGHWLGTSNAYVLLDVDGAPHLVDTGWETEPGWDALRLGLATLGSDVALVRSVTMTHMHQDHRGLVNRIREASGARVAMHEVDAEAQSLPRDVRQSELDEWGVPVARWQELRDAAPTPDPPTSIDWELSDGDQLDIPGLDARVWHTPGHSPGSICIALPGHELLFTGDHVLDVTFPGFGLGPSGREDALADYVRSLQRLLPMGAWHGLPGHGSPIPQVGARIEAIILHHLRRGAQARALQDSLSEPTVWQVAAGLRWGPGWQGLSAWHRVSALRQTELHLSFDPSRVASLW